MCPQVKQEKPIHFAARNGNDNIVRKLLSLRVDIECVNYVSILCVAFYEFMYKNCANMQTDKHALVNPCNFNVWI